MQSGREDTLEEPYAIKLCFKLGKNATETYGMLQTAFGASCIYINIYIYNHQSVLTPVIFLNLSRYLAIRPYQQLLRGRPRDGIQSSHRADQ